MGKTPTDKALNQITTSLSTALSRLEALGSGRASSRYIRGAKPKPKPKTKKHGGKIKDKK